MSERGIAVISSFLSSHDFAFLLFKYKTRMITPTMARKITIATTTKTTQRLEEGFDAATWPRLSVVEVIEVVEVFVVVVVVVLEVGFAVVTVWVGAVVGNTVVPLVFAPVYSKFPFKEEKRNRGLTKMKI